MLRHIGVATATCYPNDTARPHRQVALSLSQNEQREDDARTKQSSRARERASWSIIPHALSARDARHRRRTFPRDNRNVSTKIPSGIMVVGFPIYFCLVKSLSYTYTIDTAAKNSYFIIYYLLFCLDTSCFPLSLALFMHLFASRVYTPYNYCSLMHFRFIMRFEYVCVGIREMHAREHRKNPFHRDATSSPLNLECIRAAIYRRYSNWSPG